MKVDGKAYRSIAVEGDGWSVRIFDQTKLPFAFEPIVLKTLDDAVRAIRTMQVRGAPLIGAVGAYGLGLALREDNSDRHLGHAYDLLLATRPTAVNLRWALDDVRRAAEAAPAGERVGAAYRRAGEICHEDVALNRAIGGHGLQVFRDIYQRRGGRGPLNVLTHCNAGWLATVDWGTALAPVYLAHDEGLPVHVWVDETRPRNQGAALTAWELRAHGVPFHLIADNAGGHLMQHGAVDVVIVGSDRTTRRGDVCNKIGTYLKALAARDNGVPFYAAVPYPTIDWDSKDGVRDIPIEERAAEEVTRIHGIDDDGQPASVAIVPRGTPARNFAFDVTPARLVTGIVTERGVAEASEDGLLALYPERRDGGS